MMPTTQGTCYAEEGGNKSLRRSGSSAIEVSEENEVRYILANYEKHLA